MRKALGLAIASVLPFWLAGALLTSQSLTATHSRPVDVAELNPEPFGATAIQPPSTMEDGGNREDDDVPLDLQGNPVNSAVATYKFDATGSLYETHSPQTELPRLAPPKT